MRIAHRAPLPVVVRRERGLGHPSGGILAVTTERKVVEAMLEQVTVATRLPVQDISRARAFCAEKLGLEPVDEQPGALLYRCGGSEFALFTSAGTASGKHTQMVWHVDDIEAVVKELRARGVVFEEYDVPGLKTVNGIAEGVGGWPSKGDKGLRGARFRDSEGNLLARAAPPLIGPPDVLGVKA